MGWCRCTSIFNGLVMAAVVALGMALALQPKAYAAASHDYPVLITAANWGYKAALINFICLLHKLDMLQRPLYDVRYVDTCGYEVVVLTFDNETAAMVRKDFGNLVQQADSPTVIPVETADALEASHFGAKDWNSVTSRKLSGVLATLKGGRDVVFIDVDIAVARDPIPAILHEFALMESSPLSRPDFIFQVNNQDAPPCAGIEDVVARRHTQPSYRGVTGTKEINSGFYFLRSNTKTIKWLAAAIAQCASNKIDDQEGFIRALKELIHDGHAVYSPNCSSFSQGQEDVMRVCMFNECEFPTGWATGRYPARGDPAVENNWKWMQKSDVYTLETYSPCFQEPTTQPYVYHPNYIVGLHNKIGRLKRKGLWVAEQSECNPWHLRRSKP